MNGTVKWFNNKRGYGFITGEDNNEYFVHYSKIVSNKNFKSLKQNNNVTFDTETDEAGRVFAVNIQKRITPVIKEGVAANEN